MGEPFIHAVDERVSLHTINAKMEKYGATLSEMPGMKVTYVNHCAFYQGPALHMVLQGKMGPVTLFLVPKHLPLTISPILQTGPSRGRYCRSRGPTWCSSETCRSPSPRLPASLSHACTGPFNRP
jgi:hypothetical protein